MHKPDASTSLNESGANHRTDLTNGDMPECATRNSSKTLHQRRWKEQLHKFCK